MPEQGEGSLTDGYCTGCGKWSWLARLCDALCDGCYHGWSARFEVPPVLVEVFEPEPTLATHWFFADDWLSASSPVRAVA